MQNQFVFDLCPNSVSLEEFVFNLCSMCVQSMLNPWICRQFVFNLCSIGVQFENLCSICVPWVFNLGSVRESAYNLYSICAELKFNMVKSTNLRTICDNLFRAQLMSNLGWIKQVMCKVCSICVQSGLLEEFVLNWYSVRVQFELNWWTSDVYNLCSIRIQFVWHPA